MNAMDRPADGILFSTTVFRLIIIIGFFLVLLPLEPLQLSADEWDGGSTDQLGPTTDPWTQTSIPPGQTTDEEATISDFWAHLQLSGRPSTLKISPPTENKPLAIIMSGDLSSTLASIADAFKAFLAATGMASPPVQATDIQWISGIVDQSREALVKAGYQSGNIQVRLRASSADLQQVLENPQIGALIWIGHGQVGKIIDATANTQTGIISESPVRRWAVDFLEKKGTYKLPANYPPGSRMALAMTRIQARAHFGLNYFYSHSCLTMQDPSLALTMMAGGGRYEGYLESKLAYVTVLTPAVTDVANQEIPDVHALMVVPPLKSLTKDQARADLRRLGFTADVIEDGSDQDMAGIVYSQQPYEGTIIDKEKDSLLVTVYANKSSGDDSTSDGENQEDTGYLIWINKFGEQGRIYVGTMDQFKASRKYVDEKFAGLSTDYLEKTKLSGETRYQSLEEARKAACALVSDRKMVYIPGWGQTAGGTYGSKRVWIENLGCSIP